ncbi:MAG: HAMP domain-containing histidine kinase [Muribaculum sp.]|nr:HAMP domain-containing histidine kinase [Muribaculum sp.]
MNKTVWKIFFCFTLTAAVIAVILLVVNAFGFARILSDYATAIDGRHPKKVVREIGSRLQWDGERFMLPEECAPPEGCWCILVGDDGGILWETDGLPEDVPTHYTIRDIAVMTRWYLNDYPVYVWTTDYGLLVLGLPKDSIAKYDLQYSMDWFATLGSRAAAILAFNLALAMILALLFGAGLYQQLKRMTKGLKDLRDEKPVKIPEKGIFRELAQNLNDTSQIIYRKNRQLALRDRARQNWTAGISHDIRTPLAVVLGNAEALEKEETLSAGGRQKAAAIVTQSMKVKRLVEDLNLISSLEYDEADRRREPVKICPLIRGVVADLLNGGLSGEFEICPDLPFEDAVVLGDASLLERAVFNLIHNAVTHNPKGCRIDVGVYRRGDKALIRVRDNGAGVPDEVLARMDRMPQTTHGIGLPLVYRIAAVHGGRFTGENDGGFCGTMELPVG